MAKEKITLDVAEQATSKSKHILSGLKATVKPLQVDGKVIDTNINYYVYMNGRPQKARQPYSMLALIAEPIKALKLNKGFQNYTNATEEQMQFIHKTPYDQILKIQKTLNNDK